MLTSLSVALIFQTTSVFHLFQIQFTYAPMSICAATKEGPTWALIEVKLALQTRWNVPLSSFQLIL